MSIQRYPIGLQDFNEVITRGCVYVDKTPFVHKLITTHKYYFLSRPRRFGKSLLISTLDYLFNGKKDFFEGLYIYDKWDFDTYPVIRISFSHLPYEKNNLEIALKNELIAIGGSYSLSISIENTVKDIFKQLIQQLHKKFNRQVVVLIDEYDKPLIDYLDKENLHKAIENRAELKSFYSVLKDADPHLKMVFITGVSKFSQVSIFSDLNNLNDISLDYDYNSICGINQEELEENFKEELLVHDKQKIKEWYNGYRWDIEAKSVYNPFSLLNFFAKGGKYTNFWYTTGTPTFLMKKSREEQFYKFDEVKSSAFKLQSFDIENIDLIATLFQTGYLTITGKDEIFDDYILTFPNREVKQAYLEKLADTYIFAKGNTSKAVLDNLLKSFRAHNSEQLEKAINLAFAQIPYDLWQKENEHFYHAIIHLLFSLLGVYIQSEVHTQDGRADAIVHFENNVYFMEFKLNKKDVRAYCNTPIQPSGYLDKYVGIYNNTSLHKIGINFSSENKKVDGVIWEVEE